MHAALFSRIPLLTGAVLVLPSLFGCLDHPLKAVEYELTQEGKTGVDLIANKDVDVLFVIDNSGSMGEEQATLAANFGAFISKLEQPEVDANYRIGVTTTDNGNPWCSGTSPEAGMLRMSSCRTRPEEFVYDGEQSINAVQEACYDVCPEEWATIEVQPTEIEPGGAAEVRPWLENIEGKTNLPEGLSTTQAFQCLGPQGINGCGFESHLESMWKALRRSQTETEPSYGFIRESAILSIVHVTDEADCSANADWDTIFLPEGDRVFWSDPTAVQPSSAVCWNAGVACTGSGTYDECHSVNLDADGNEVTDDPANDAVLHPVDRYTEFVQKFEDAKQRITPDQEVLVAVIGGVNGDGSITYQDTIGDPEFQADFGIGPGCSSEAGTAVPPVRLAEFAHAFSAPTQENLFSICESDYSPALEAIGDEIIKQVVPSCMTECVGDSDPTTPDVLDPSCVLLQQAPRPNGSFAETVVPECEDGGSPPDDADVCYVALIGDTMSDFCEMRGWNLEFDIVRRDGVPAPARTVVNATCELSQNRRVDCPGLP